MENEFHKDYKERVMPALKQKHGYKNVHEIPKVEKVVVNTSVGSQADVKQALEDAKIELANAPAKEFFTMLWENTGEGFFADPIYGGNRDFTGWKLIGYPGPRYNYVNEIEQYGKRYAMPTVGLAGRSGQPLANKG
jgi:gluconate 2-dehydrogenase gamma chain